MFAAPTHPAPPAHAPNPVSPLSNPAPGEFTRYFQAPVAPKAQTPHPAYQNPLGNAQAPPPANSQGEFTRMFGVPSIPNEPPAGAVAMPGYMPPAPPAAPSAPSPGEYTRMFMPGQVPAAPPAQQQSMSAPPAAVAPAAPQVRTTRPQKKKPSYIPLLIILGIVFLLAITLVLFFALRK
jgi:hypothetical protein